MKNKRFWTSMLPKLTLLIIYLISRLFHLGYFPMFADEGLHIWRAIVVTREGPFAEILRVGKFLTIWIMSLFVPFASNNLLWVARFISVVFGMLGLVGCYLLGKRLFNRRIGLIAAMLYLVIPYTFFYDRMAHVDGPLTVLAIYVTLFSLIFVDQPNLKYSLVLGITLMLTIMTKLNGFVLGVLPLLVLVTQRFRSLRNFPWLRLVWVYIFAALGFIPLLLNSSTHLDDVWDKMRATRPPDALPIWTTWLLNGQDMVHFLALNLSWLVFIMVCLGIVRAIIRRQRTDWLLIGGAALTLGVFVLVSKANGWYPRYLLPAVPFLLLIAAQTIDWSLNKLRQLLQNRPRFYSYAISGAAITIIILPALWFDYQHLVDPPRTPFVEIDQWQYVKGAYAGYGLDEAANFIREQLPPSGQIVVVYDLHPGSIYDVLQVYLYDQHERIIHVIFDFRYEDPQTLAQSLASQSRPVFVVTADPPNPGAIIDIDTWPYLERVAHFDRPGGLTGINIYKGK